MVDDTTTALLAANLRRLRIARHLSLSELARATRVGKATLSGIENGRANPTVETLAALAGAMRVPLVELLAEPPAGEVRIVRAAQQRFDRRDGIKQRPVDELEGLSLTEFSLSAREVHELAARPAGSRAHLYVLQGKLIAGPVERCSELGPGDYASFPTDVPHIYESGRNPARALLMATA